MSVRPIDLQTMIPKVQEHKQNKELAQNKVQNDQNIILDKSFSEADRRMSQVIKSDSKYDSLINDESPGKGGLDSGDENDQYKDEKSKDSEDEKDGNFFLENEVKMEALSAKNKQYSSDKKFKSHLFHKFDLKV